ncbi:MAG TPA: hypothetical protein VGN90_07515 [Pyrinomonadaceae bacterium]|jgi:hypothetical protein|nr:hypothetical protein [Pyrinomonadaceae bacterium]
MPREVSFDQPTQGVELGSLLANTIGAVVEAQERMDDYTLRRKQEFEEAPEGSLALPPLWYVFDKVAVEVELSTTIRSSRSRSAASLDRRTQPLLFCHTLNPTMVSLYGYQASAGLKIRMQFGPRANLPLKSSDDHLRSAAGEVVVPVSSKP